MEDVQIVFFDVETSGFGMDAEVLQIAMKSDDSVFNEYVMPKNGIPSNVTRMNNFSIQYGRLCYNDEEVDTIPPSTAISFVMQYLQDFDRPCLLVAHNCPFDSSHLLRLIRKEHLEDEFAEIVFGFTDTLSMLRYKFAERGGKGAFKLTTLAEELGLSTDGAHNAFNDVRMLEDIAYHYFRCVCLIEASKSFSEVLNAHINAEKRAKTKKTLAPLKGIVSKNTITRIAAAGISYKMLRKAFERGSDEEVTALLKGKANGIRPVIWSTKVLYDILNHLESLDPIYY